MSCNPPSRLHATPTLTHATSRHAAPQHNNRYTYPLSEVELAQLHDSLLRKWQIKEDLPPTPERSPPPPPPPRPPPRPAFPSPPPGAPPVSTGLSSGAVGGIVGGVVGGAVLITAVVSTALVLQRRSKAQAYKDKYVSHACTDQSLCPPPFRPNLSKSRDCSAVCCLLTCC